MGVGASTMHPGASAARYAAKEASTASTEELTDVFAKLSDSERQRLREALQSVNATPSKAAGPIARSEKRANPLDLDFSCFGTKCTRIPDPARRGIKSHQLLGLKAFIEKHADKSSGVFHGWVKRVPLLPIHKDSLDLYALVKYVVLAVY